MTKREIIIDAIEKKKQLFFFYGKPGEEKWREVSPHKFGVKHTDGEDSYRVFGFQFDGRSHDGELVEGKWRCFKLDGCLNVRSKYRDGTFYTEETLGTGRNFCMDEVICEAQL